MKINEKNKRRTLMALQGLTRILQVDLALNKKVKPEEFPHKRDYWWFTDFQNTLDIVYLLMVNKTETEVQSRFGTPPNIGQEPTKPVGWYKTEFYEHEHYIKGPEGCQGFIPDCINDLILDTKLDALYKYNLIYRMFSDLIKIDKKFEKRKKK